MRKRERSMIVDVEHQPTGAGVLHPLSTFIFSLPQHSTSVKYFSDLLQFQFQMMFGVTIIILKKELLLLLGQGTTHKLLSTGESEWI